LQPTAYVEWRAEYERDLTPALERVKEQLQLPANVVVRSMLREGKPAKELLKVTEELPAHVIVVGSKGLGLLDRLLVGSTASGIIRGAQNAVFALPLAGIATREKDGAVAEPSAVGA
jgi:nucleotide-binding universal stress UspA family protein